MRKVLLAAFLLTAVAAAQTPLTQHSITATGSSTTSVTPDMALVDVGVTTNAASAQEASTQNATTVSSVLASIRGVLGNGADIKTVSYSLVPVYSNGSTTGQKATITGYTATNIVEATVVDLSMIGKVIDAAISGGANPVQGILFGLRDPNPALSQALKQASAQAVAHAQAIASGLGVTTGSVIHATQVTNVVSTGVASSTPASSATPVETGLVQVRGTVTIEVGITP